MSPKPALTVDMVTAMTELAQFRLWQLISPALPVGVYAYSGGLEAAVEQGHVHDPESCRTWLQGLIENNLAHVDLPVYVRLYDAWRSDDAKAVALWNRRLQAMRETSELLAEDRHMGTALQRLLLDLDIAEETLPAKPSFATMYALACVRWQINLVTGANGLAWAWLENQVAAAVKLIPLGQTDGQRLLGALLPAAEASVARALALADDDLGSSLPGLAILSSGHEQQYSRLFRS